MMSALAAFDTAGNPADAVIQVIANAEFFVDRVPPGVCPGKILLAPLRGLLPFETTIKVTVTENPFTTPAIKAVQNPGDPEVVVIVDPDNAYRIEMIYGVRVLHGVDPPFGVTIPFTVEAFPKVPAINRTAALLLALVVGAGALVFGLRTRTG